MDEPQSVRHGRIIIVEEHQEIIIDSNGQDIPFDTLECMEMVYEGASVSFYIIPSDDGLRATRISLFRDQS